MHDRPTSESPSTPAPVSRRDFVLAGASAAGIAWAGLTAAADAAPPAQAPGLVKVFIRSVKQARLFDLSHVWDETSPIAGVNPPYSMTLNRNHGVFDAATNPNGTRGIFGDGGQLSFTSEVQAWSGQHGAPSIDALAHIGHNGLLFGGVDGAAATSNPLGVGRSGVGAHLDIAHYPEGLLVNRGVLLDVARFVQGNLTPLPAGFEITGQHLADTAAAEGVTLEPGDTVLIRTGWGQHFAGNPALYAGPDSPGPGVDGAQFLVDSGARVVGDDTLTFEKRPPLVFAPVFQVFPVHMLLIADHGIFIIENFQLEGLAAAGVYEFLLVVPPIKIRGGTGSALRAFALTP
jgi:kynurenine formamidase